MIGIYSTEQNRLKLRRKLCEVDAVKSDPLKSMYQPYHGDCTVCTQATAAILFSTFEYRVTLFKPIILHMHHHPNERSFIYICLILSIEGMGDGGPIHY